MDATRRMQRRATAIRVMGVAAACALAWTSGSISATDSVATGGAAIGALAFPALPVPA